MSRPFYQPNYTRKGWRIQISHNGATIDLCGAETEAVAWEQCAIFNRLTALLRAEVGT